MLCDSTLRRFIRPNFAFWLGVITAMSLTSLFARSLPLDVGVFALAGSKPAIVLNSLRVLFAPRPSA